jgi:hypothetical protein
VSDKRQALDSVIEKLIPLLAHLDNANEGERGNALARVNSLLAKAGLDWRDLGLLLQQEKPSLLEMLNHLLAKDADVLIRIGLQNAKFFHTAADIAFANVMINGHRVTMQLGDAMFDSWLRYRFFVEKQKAPASGAVKSAIATLAAHAQFGGERHEVHLRVAGHDGKIYLDLGDETWHAIEIDATGWRVIPAAPVRFRRSPDMAALPIPQRGGSIEDLRCFINLTDESFVLFVSALLDALRPGQARPLFYFAGEEGAAKTTTAAIARSLIDPSSLPSSTLPGTVEDLFVRVHGSHMLPFDNVSVIPPKISDALCQISSGTGFTRRKRYTDTGQLLIAGSRPIIMTGRKNAIDRPDLADRAIVASLEAIAPDKRRSEASFWSELNCARPMILGALLDAVVHGLRELPCVHLERLPRLADFARWAVACEGAFAKPGAFLSAFGAHTMEAMAEVIENDPVALAVHAFMSSRQSWAGTATELFAALQARDQTEEQVSKWKSWPADPAAFGKKLREVAGALRKLGVSVDHNKRSNDYKRTRRIELRRGKPMYEAKSEEEESAHRQPQAEADADVTSDLSTAVAKIVNFHG